MAKLTDQQGFIITATREEWKTSSGVWSQIRRDVTVIRAVMERGGKQTASGARGRRVNAAQTLFPPVLPTVTPRRAGSRVQGPSSPPSSPPAGRQPRNPPRNTNQSRDPGSGRFTAGSGRNAVNRPGAAAGTDDARNPKDKSQLGEALKDALKQAGDHAAGLDPAVAAAKEVKETLSPATRVLGRVFGLGKDRKKERWYERIWKELAGIGKSMRGNRAPQTRASLARRMMTGVGGAAGSVLGGLGGLAMKALPMLGSALTGLAGLVVPALVVAAGGLIGTAVGTWIYDKFGPQIVDAMEATADYLKSAWDSVTTGFGDAADWVRKKFDGIVGTVSDTFSSIADAINKIVGWVSDKLGVVVAPVKKAAGAVVDTASRGMEAVANSKAGQAVASGYAGARNAMSRNFEQLGAAKDWALGKTSAMFESGKGGAGTISSGNGDFGGKSYGSYQLSSKAGTLQEFLKQSPYGQQFSGLAAGSPEFDRKWKELAGDKGFGAAQHDFIKTTHFDPAMKALADQGVDVQKLGPAAMDALWSTSVQFGAGKAGGAKGAVPMVMKALEGKDLSKLDAGGFVSSLQDYKIANNDRLFGSSSESVRAGTLHRASAEKESLLALTSQLGARSATGAASVAASAPAMNNVPDAPAVTEASTRLASITQNSQTVVMPPQDVGQDMKDRRLAHVQTGGIGVT